MSKLSQFNPPLSLSGAANYLSNALEEQVSLVDLYELALEGHLSISIRLVDQAYAMKTTMVLHSDLKSGSDHVELALPDEHERRIRILNGVHDLAMVGIEKYEIRKLYQQETHGALPMLAEMNGFYIKIDGYVYQLLNSLPVSANEEYREVIEDRLESLLKSKGLTSQSLFDDPHAVFDCLDSDEIEQVMELVDASELDEDGGYPIPLEKHNYQFVIRYKELERFVTSLDEAPTINRQADSTLFPLEKRSYLNFINILLNAQELNPAQRGISSAFRLMSDNASIPISDNTIRKILRELVEISD